MGTASAIYEDATGTNVPPPDPSSGYAEGYKDGNTVGHVGMVVTGAGEMIVGAAAAAGGVVAAPETGGASLAVAEQGTAVAAHGLYTVNNALRNLTEDKNGGQGGQEGGKNAPNPDGSKGKADHQEKVKELAQKAEKENPGMDIVTERKIQAPNSNRRPDVQVVDPKSKKTTKIYEAERKPNSTRNKRREAEYDRLNIPHETHKVGGR